MTLLHAYRTQTGEFLGWDHNGLAENWQQLEIWCFLYDVKPGMAPLCFLPSDGPEALADLDDKTEVEQVLVPAGSVAVWSMFTRHSASESNPSPRRCHHAITT